MITRKFFTLFFLTGVLMASALPKFETKTLSNGMEVVAIKLKQNSVATVDVFYKVGSRNEVMGKSGIAHMLEHLNFKSTKNLKAGEFDEIVKGFGGVNNASTGFDYTHYYINSSSQNVDRSMGLFAELMQNQNLKNEEFLPEREVVAEERRWRTDNNPMGYLYFNLFNLAFGYHSYHWTPIGFMNDILTWKIDDIKSFHSRFYQPSNAILVVAGDIDPQEIFKQAQKHFGKIKNNGEIPVVHMQEPKQDGEKRAIVYKDTNVEMLAIAYKIPNFEDNDIVALSAISEMLSSGKSSRLQKELADKKRLVNSIYGYSMDLKDPGLFIFMAVCNEGVKAEY
jgi:zinc protease